MTPTPNEKTRDQLAFEWVKKDDGSLGHCPDCFKAGFDAGHSLANESAQKEIEKLKEKLTIWTKAAQASTSERDASNARAARFEEALQKVNFDWCNDLDEAASMCREALAYDSEKKGD